MSFSLIAAVDKKMGIGKTGCLPWHLPTDLAYFNKITTGEEKNIVIMGRRTWESIPPAHKPLKNRINIVITRSETYQLPLAVFRAASLEEALKSASRHNPKEIFIIGGAQIFAEAVSHPDCAKIYLTEIDGAFDCDTFFPEFDKNIFKKTSASEIHEENGAKFQFVIYEKRLSPKEQTRI